MRRVSSQVHDVRRFRSRGLPLEAEETLAEAHLIAQSDSSLSFFHVFIDMLYDWLDYLPVGPKALG